MTDLIVSMANWLGGIILVILLVVVSFQHEKGKTILEFLGGFTVIFWLILALGMFLLTMSVAHSTDTKVGWVPSRSDICTTTKEKTWQTSRSFLPTAMNKSAGLRSSTDNSPTQSFAVNTP